MNARVTLIGGMAIAGFVISLVLLFYVIKMESRKREQGGTDSWPPQMR
jgi:hypothetical protein